MAGKIVLIAAFIFSAIAATTFAAEAPLCGNDDGVCKDFENSARAERFDEIIRKVDPAKQYSEGARISIGKAYLAIAGREENTPEQEERYCRKALEYGQVQAYMGLYFLYAEKDPQTALGFLREYVMTGPADPVPFVILGESELGSGNYRAADVFLREAKRVARARAARVDWMLFEANYLLRNYDAAGELLESALADGKFDDELKALSSDGRFAGIGERPEFRKHRDLFTRSTECC